jgi:alkanesulfonate monooxygenase SsuD/methylene tetrahydromethanopterin reductase-like flavin-dependent oxidoreductase (luciferase family)
VAAKQLSAVDHLSEGRLVAGIGAGHLAEEFDLLNLDFSNRGRVMDERLPELILALENEFVAGFGASPRPTQQPRPPVWIAGSSAPAIRRAVDVGDGWLPQGPATPRLVESLKDRLARAQRPIDGFAIGHIAPPIHLGAADVDLGKYTITGSATQVADRLLSAMPADVNQIQIRVMANSLDEYCAQLSWAGAELLPLLR